MSPRRRSSVTGGGGGNRKSSIGCSSLIPRTPHTPRGLLRGVLSAFPVMEPATAQSESFAVSAALNEDAGQEEVFGLVRGDVAAVLSGERASVLCYGVAESGKSYTLWGTEADRGLAPRALEYLFAHAPAGSRVTLSLVGLDDTSVVDYLAPSEQQQPQQNPVFRDMLDGSKGLARGTSVVAESAAAAWDAVLEGLSRALSNRHLLLTVNVVVPCDAQESSLVGALQIAELALPGAEERMSRNLSTLHDIVRGLVDKNFAGAVDYSGSLLTTVLQPAFGGNARTTVVLNVHPSIVQYHHTIQTLSFGEHCSKLKNLVAPVKIAGVRPVATVDAPAEMVRQLQDVRQYAEDLEMENDDLRQRTEAWEARHEDGKRRHELALQREREACRTQVVSAEAEVASVQLQLQQARVTIDMQELALSRLRVQLVRLAPQDLVEVEQSAAVMVERLQKEVADLKTRLEARPAADIRQQLVALQSEAEELRSALAAYQQQASQQPPTPRVVVPSSGLLREKDAQIAAMSAEMDLKEREMEEREKEIEEHMDTINFLKSQIHTINFLKASVVSGMAVAPPPRAAYVAPVATAPARKATKATKTVGPSDEAVAATKVRAKEQAAARRRKREQQEEEERKRREAEEEDARLEEEMRREQERQEKQARARAKKQREQEARERKKRDQEAMRKPMTPPPPPRPVAVLQKEKQLAEEQAAAQDEEEGSMAMDVELEEQQEEVQQEEAAEVEQEAVEFEGEEAAPQPQSRKSSQKKQKRAPEPAAAVEEPANTPLPARSRKAATKKPKAKPIAATAAAAAPPPLPKSPVPVAKASRATKRVPSPNENVEADQQQEEPAQKRGRKKLYNGAEKKTRRPEFRKSLAPTPASAGPATRLPNRPAALGRLEGADDYRAMLGDLLESNLYAVQTPSK